MDAKRQFLTSEMMADRFAEYCRVEGLVGKPLTGAKAKELWQVAVNTLFTALTSPQVSGLSVSPWGKYMVEHSNLLDKKRVLRLRRSRLCDERLENIERGE